MNLEKISAISACLILFAALVMSFLAVKPDELDHRLAFVAIVGLLFALVILGLGKIQ